MMLTFEQQLTLKEKVEKILDKEIGFIIASPYAEIIDSLVSKIEEVGGQTNVNEPTDAPVTTSDAINSTTTTDASTTTTTTNPTV